MDQAIVNWLTGFAARSEAFDISVNLVATNVLTKGVPIAMMFLFLWFLPRADQTIARTRLLALLALTIVSISIGRLAALALPYRLRPIHDETLGLRLPLSVTREVLDGWSSFPSDHAVLFATLAAGFWMVNRGAGIAFTLFSLLVIGFGRVYLTFHYPSDILGGALLGLVVTLVLMRPFVALVRRSGLLDAAERWPQYFQPLLFIMLFQISTMFYTTRQIVSAVHGMLT